MEQVSCTSSPPGQLPAPFSGPAPILPAELSPTSGPSQGNKAGLALLLLGTAWFIVTKTHLAPGRGVSCPLEQPRTPAPPRLRSYSLLRFLNSGLLSDNLWKAFSSGTLPGHPNQGLQWWENIRRWVALRGLAEDSGLQSWIQPLSSHLGSARGPPVSPAQPRPCASLAAVGCARSAWQCACQGDESFAQAAAAYLLTMAPVGAAPPAPFPALCGCVLFTQR